MPAQIEMGVDMVSVIAPIIIVAGMIKQYVYYKQFRIQIFLFMTIDEVVISFADNLLSYLLILLSSVCFLIPFLSNVDTLKIVLSDKILIERVMLYFAENTTLIFLTILLNVALLAFGYFRKNIVWYETILNLALTWLAFWVLPIVIIELRNALSLEHSTMTNIYITVLAISLFFYCITTALSEAYKVKELQYYWGAEVDTKNEIIISDETLYYVGQSKNYVFFFDPINKASEVIPISTVNKFTFKK